MTNEEMQRLIPGYRPGRRGLFEFGIHGPAEAYIDEGSYRRDPHVMFLMQDMHPGEENNELKEKYNSKYTWVIRDHKDARLVRWLDEVITIPPGSSELLLLT